MDLGGGGGVIKTLFVKRRYKIPFLPFLGFWNSLSTRKYLLLYLHISASIVASRLKIKQEKFTSCPDKAVLLRHERKVMDRNLILNGSYCIGIFLGGGEG